MLSRYYNVRPCVAEGSARATWRAENCRLCSAPWMVIDVTEAHNLADGNAEKLQRLGLLNQSMIMRLRSSRFSGSE